MMPPRRKQAFAMATLTALAMLPVSAASADTASEIRALKARLRQLEREVSTQQHEKVPASLAHRKGPIEVEQPYPDRFFYKGITIKPGGFFALEGVWRSRFIGADISTPYQNIPLGNNIAGHTQEYRLTARQSRLSLEAQGKADEAIVLTGYGEFDFLGAAQTANSNESNSFNPRVRHLYANVDMNDWGLHALAGQNWSLATMNSSGIKRDSHLTPPTIDAQYVPGFIWARQPQFRITKDIIKDQVTAALSIENPATTFVAPGVDLAGRTATFPGGGTAIGGLIIPGAFNQLAVGGSLFNSANALTFNRVPDIIGKVAVDYAYFDRKIHIEGFGILRDVTDRAWFGNHSVWTGGGGGGATVELMPKFLDFQISGLIGRGIGRYGTAQISDATFTLSGAPSPIAEKMILFGLTMHATPQTDFYVFAGGEFAEAQSSFIKYPSVAVPFAYGYGNLAFNNTSCDLEPGGAAYAAAPGTTFNCTANIKSVRQVTTGVWHNFYEGPFGKLRGGAQYSYTEKAIFPGIGATPAGKESMILTSLRYYPF